MLMDSRLVEQARNADMIAFLEKNNGFTFYAKRGAYRCKQHPSLAVKGDRLSWYWHSKGVGGFGAIDFLMKIENTSFREAVETVTGINPVTREPQNETPRPVTLFLPEKAGLPLRLYDYLCVRRGISRQIVDTLMREGKIYEDRRGNVVFVAYDEQNKPRFASVRGTYDNKVFRMDCVGSDKRYGFNTAAEAPSERLHVFESAIDLMSHATIANMEYADKAAWKYDRRLSLGGTSEVALSFFLNQHKEVRELDFCLDNDAPGLEASDIMAKKYADMGYSTKIVLPAGKDFSEDLATLLLENKRKNRAKSSHRDVVI